MTTILAAVSHDFSRPFSDSILVFGLLLFIALLAPIILKRLNIPSIIGLILAGVIIGPYGLNFVAGDNGGVEMFSRIGLLYIMFIVGLELDLNEFAKYRNKSLMFGLFTFLLPLLIGFPLCYYILGYSFDASFLTASMFATHTLVTYPIVSRMGVSKNQAVAITVGGTILTDTAVLIILAIIMANNQGALDMVFFLRLVISLIVFSGIMFFIVPRVAKWFFQQSAPEKYTTYVFVLFVVFMASFLAELGGIEAIIGAFAAGLALNRLIPHSSALMNRIEFIGNAIFIPIFLISVGMMVNIAVVFNGTRTLVVAIVLTVGAVVGKWLAAYLTQKMYRYSLSQRNLIFGLSSAHAAATLAIIIVGYRQGILDEYILNGTIILILITCVIASFMTQKAAKQLALEDEDEHTVVTPEEDLARERILVPIANPSHVGQHVKLAMLMKDKKSTHPIGLLGVVPNNTEAEQNIINFRKYLQDFVENATAAEVDVDIITTIDHNPTDGIFRIARETMTNLVLLGWPGKIGFIDKLIGDKMDAMINTIDKNLFVCHVEEKLVGLNRIVVASPPFAEKEAGFLMWVDKIGRLSSELSLPVLHLGHPKTQEVIKSLQKIGNITFETFDNWKKPMKWTARIHKKDLIVLVSAHNGYVSYIPELDRLPTQLERKFPHHSRIVIYPKMEQSDTLLKSDDSIFVPSNF